MSKDNCWRRNIQPRLAEAGLGWVNFQVMRRTHATLMKALGADGKLVADQLGHSLDVNQNVYTQSSVESRLGIDTIGGVHLVFRMKTVPRMSLKEKGKRE
jgi:integrase